MMLKGDHSFRDYKDIVSLKESWAGGKLEAKDSEEHYLLQICMLSNVLQTAMMCQMRKQQKSDACWNKLILSKRAQKTLS